MTTSKMLTTATVAERIGVTTRTLGLWRAAGEGPSHFQVSERVIRYPEDELNEWIAARYVKAGA